MRRRRTKLNLVIWLAGYLVIGNLAIGLSAHRLTNPTNPTNPTNLINLINPINPTNPVSSDVSGVVRDARGRGMGDVKVSLQRVQETRPKKAGDKPAKDLRIVESIRTAATGAFRFEAVPAGRYQLLLARGTNWLIAEGLVINDKPRGPIVLTMDGRTRVMSIGKN